jgi:23S rRNA (adenine2503-C2)-methyltransferase
VDESEYSRPSNAAVGAFRRALEAAGIATSLRVTRGLEAAAACGQLRNSFQKQALPEPEPLR